VDELGEVSRRGGRADAKRSGMTARGGARTIVESSAADVRVRVGGGNRAKLRSQGGRGDG
jgi:hypothetical protein